MDKLKPNDPRAESKTTNLNGKTYHYLLANPPSGRPRDTILLLHGFPDLSLGWRYQVPLLLSLNLRVIVPDLLGYGGTDAPEDVGLYTFKSVAADMAELVGQVCGHGSQVILGGHDWGGALAWRVVLWHPALIKAVFSVCVPYFPPNPNFVELKTMVDAGHMRHFAYQLQLAEPGGVEGVITTRQQIRDFLNAMYGGQHPTDTVPPWDPVNGMRLNALAGRADSRYFTRDELDFYADRYSRTGMRGPLCWYRTRKLLHSEEMELVNRGPDAFVIKVPALYIGATNDTALPPSLADGMGKWCPKLRKELVEATHWALWHTPEEVNGFLSSWIGDVLKERGPRASI